MKKGIHPTYHKNAEITCSCGAVLVTGSTQESLKIEICSQCHPLYTGKKKVLDTTGRVDRFKKLAAKAETKAKTNKSKTEKLTKKAEKKKK